MCLTVRQRFQVDPDSMLQVTPSPSPPDGESVAELRNVQCNLKITQGMEDRMTALAAARKLTLTELLMRALNAYTTPDVDDDIDDNYKHIDFAPLLVLARVACFSSARSRHRRA